VKKSSGKSKLSASFSFKENSFLVRKGKRGTQEKGIPGERFGSWKKILTTA
jgi:hypothetical protein